MSRRIVLTHTAGRVLLAMPVNIQLGIMLALDDYAAGRRGIALRAVGSNRLHLRVGSFRAIMEPTNGTLRVLALRAIKI